MVTDNIEFPRQKVSGKEKSKESWYANCIDYVIAKGISNKNLTDITNKLNVLHGNIPNEFYKKTLNPYNSDNERYTRFPATMHNLDIMSDIVRRYVSEYFKSPHEFVVCASNPEIILKKNDKLRQAVELKAQEAFVAEFERRLAELQQQDIQQGGDGSNVNPQDALPDAESFMKEFNEKYIDEESKQAQDVLDYIRSVTNDMILYLSAYFDYICLGECYTYTDIRGDKIIKEHVPAIEAYPVANSNFYIEDYDMFARRMVCTFSQIMDKFNDVLSKKDREFLEQYYYDGTDSPKSRLDYSSYFDYTPQGCEKFTEEERALFRQNPVTIDKVDGGFEVWHVVWRGEAKKGILTRINEIGLEEELVVEEDYKFNPDAGDINIDWKYETQIYEGYRIGTRNTGVYPIKARPIAYQRDNKLPYNGIIEVLPNMGHFSIVEIITPYQVLRNIFSYHREMVIAKNKALILLLPKSLVASDSEDKVYKMAADGVLLVDDTEDITSQKMANIRMLNSNLGDYINQLTNLIDTLKYEAREMVDMNMQRYGEIANSAGLGITQEAASRSSMGSVILVTMFDSMRRLDYQRDLDYAKLAYINGLKTSFFDDSERQRYLSLDINSFINSDYNVLVRNDQREIDKLKSLKDWAFSAAQNGDLEMALAAITGNNVTQIKETINKFSELKRQHEEAMKQADQMLQQQELQGELAKIQAQGEQDRLTKQAEYQYKLQMQYNDLGSAALNKPDNSNDNMLKSIIEENKNNIAREKMNIDKAKITADLYNKNADRELKREELDNQLKIAKTNKNRYDK